MPNLEEGLIEQHQDGYLQIKPGYPWQIISEPREEFPDGSILYRIFRGWNERRLVAGLPLYWYGKNPNASGLLGGDAEFTEFENPLTVPNPTYTLDDARIYPKANLQNVAFWRKLQEVVVEKNGEEYKQGITTILESFFSNNKKMGYGGFVQYPSGNKDSDYTNITVLKDEFFGTSLFARQFIPIAEIDSNIFPASEQRSAPSEIIFNFENAYNDCGKNYKRYENQILENGYIKTGDVISINTINDLLRVYSRITSFCAFPYGYRKVIDGLFAPRSSNVSYENIDEGEQFLLYWSMAALRFGNVLPPNNFGYYTYGSSQWEETELLSRFQNISRTIFVWHQESEGEGEFEYYPYISQIPDLTYALEEIPSQNYTVSVSKASGNNGLTPPLTALDIFNAPTSGDFYRRAAMAIFMVFHQYQFSDLPIPP